MASQGAKVDDIEALKTLRVALIKFQEIGNAALSGAESDVDRTLGWMEQQGTFWTGQLRKRHDEVMKCEEAVRSKRLFKGADGRVQSAGASRRRASCSSTDAGCRKPRWSATAATA